MPVSIGPRIGVQGADEFRQQFRLMAQEAKRFKTELDEVKASFTANDTAMDRSKATTEQLTKQLDQNTKVMQSALETRDKAREAVERANQAYKEELEKLKDVPKEVEKNAKAVADATEKYNTQNKATEEAKKNYDNVKKSLDEATKKVNVQQQRVDYLKDEYDKHNAALKEMRKQYGKNNEEVKKAKEAVDAENQAYKNAKAELSVYKKEKQEISKEHTAAKKALADETKELNENAKALEKANKANKPFNELLNEQDTKVHNAATRLYEAQNVLSQYDEKVSEVTIDQKKLNDELANTPGKLDILSSRMTDLGGVFENVGTALSTYVTAPLAALGTYGVKNASNLTDGMAKIYTIATETQEPMAEMKQGLIDLSDATGFALDDLTEAAYQAVSASVDAGNAVEFMGDATRLARAGFTTTEKSVDLLTTIMNAYGKETYTASYLSDLLLRTQNDGKTIVDQLAASMGTVIPTAAAYNVGIEQVAAAYATMTKQGVNTARATTMLNALFTELEKPDKDAAKTIAALNDGKTFAQLMKEGKSLGDVLGMLYNNLDKDSEAFANLFVNVRSARAANALMADDSKILNYELERMSDVTGQTDYALEMLETPSLKARRALNKLKNSTIDLGDTLIGALYPLFEKLVNVVDDFRNWVKGLTDAEKKNITTALAWVAAIGPMLKVAGGLISGIGGAIEMFSKLRKATKGATTLGKAITAIIDAEGLGFTALAQTVGIAVGAYAALGAAAKFSYDSYREGIVATNELKESEKALIDSSTQLHDSTMQMNTASRQEADAINVNAEKAQALAEKYNWLMDNTTMTAESKKKLADVYLTQLAEAMGMEIEDVQALIDENGKLSASIDEVIQKKRAEALLKAYEDDYGEAMKNRSQAEKEDIQLTTQKKYAEDQLTQAQQDLTYWTNRATEEAKTANGVSEETQRHLDEAVIAHSAANASYNETAEALDNANESYQTIMQTIDGFEGATVALATGSAHEIEAALIKLTDGFITAERGTKESLEKQVKNAEENLAKVQKAFDEGADGVTQEMLDAYRKLRSDAQLELDKWVKLNGEKSKEVVEGFVDDITKYKEPIKNATKDTMGVVPEEAGKQMKRAAGTADTGMQGVINQLRGHITSMTNTGTDLATAITNVFKDSKYYDQMFSAGSHFMEGFVNGLKAVNVNKTSNKIMTDTVQSSKQTLHISSPSKVMEEVGRYFSEGFAIGIADETAMVKRASSAMAQSAVDSSWMTSNYTPTGLGYMSQGMSSNTRNITAPINVNVNVSGNVDDVDALADVIAERINDQIIRKNEVFA